MDETDSATKGLVLEEASINEHCAPMEKGVDSDTESEAEVTTMTVMGEPGTIDIGAESLPNPDDAEATFAGTFLSTLQWLLARVGQQTFTAWPV